MTIDFTQAEVDEIHLIIGGVFEDWCALRQRYPESSRAGQLAQQEADRLFDIMMKLEGKDPLGMPK